MENNNPNDSSRPDRKLMERNRRTQMKALFSKLNSLLPHHNSRAPTSLPDQLHEAAKYIKKLQMDLERVKEKKDMLMRDGRWNNTRSRSNEPKSPEIQIHEMGSSLVTGYAMTGKLNAKSDVYSFGVVLLELLTSRKPVDHTLPRGQQSLVAWATPRLSEDKVRQCVDQILEENYPPKTVAKMVAVAALCVQYEADFRSNMSIVVKALVVEVDAFNLGGMGCSGGL